MNCRRTGKPCVWGYRKRTKIDEVWIESPERCSNCGREKP